MIRFQTSTRFLSWLTLLAITVLLSACSRSEPSASQIQAYIENYQIAHDYHVVSMAYDVEPKQRGESGSIQVSGKLELREPLYVEDLGNKAFRKSVAKLLRRNRFSEREINHEIYDRVIRSVARVSESEHEYYTFLKQEQAPGYAINFSADLKYKKGVDGFMLDGPVRHPKLTGARIIKFANPVVDSSQLVEKAVRDVLAEQIRYREMMKESSAILSRFWDNDYGLLIWNRKVPYLGNENLSPNERAQLNEFSAWRGVFRVSNIKPVQYRTPHASNFFELGSYTTTGVATCLRPTGFIDELQFAKSKFDHYCEFGKQYPVKVELASVLSDTNQFLSSVKFEINGVSSGELVYDSDYFKREHNELARYSDQQRVVILDQPFDIKAHSRPVFNLVKSDQGESGKLRLEYSGASDYQLARFDTLSDTKSSEEGEIVIVSNDDGIDSDATSDSRDATSDSRKASATQKSITTNSQGGELSDNDATVHTSVNESAEPTSEEKSIAKPLTKKELVKAIQIELKRLNVYDSSIDGVAGEHTFWSMAYVEKQIDKGSFSKPSTEFLAVLVGTPESAIELPANGYRQVVAKPAAKSEKRTVAGKALKSTGRALDNAANWVGGLFSGKKSKKNNTQSDADK